MATKTAPQAPTPPIEPMLARTAEALPEQEGFLFEPKWDGFRTLVFRGADDIYLQSRDQKQLNRYFPELEKALLEMLPRGCVLDGEIVVATPKGLDFDALQQRIHPAPSIIARLAKETPASFVAFDLLAAGGRSTMELTQAERRERLERLLGSAKPPLRLSPMTRDRAQAQQWLTEHGGRGIDGIMAKLEKAAYQAGKRAMLKIKPVRSADCVVAGFRWYKGRDDAVGALLLGLYDEVGVLRYVGEATAFPMEMREQLATELAPLRAQALDNHPWREATDLQGEPLRPERVCEVKYDQLLGGRFRQEATFLRWRTDKAPLDCRYDQLEVTTPFELAKLFGA